LEIEMKFRYIVIDWEWAEGPYGVDNLADALQWASQDCHTVVDVVTGKLIGTTSDEVKPVFWIEDEDEDEDEDDQGRTIHPSLIKDPEEDTPEGER
jgi:hypothetical protein